MIEASPEEAMRARGLPDPGTPTKQQVEEHELALLPFRPWCQTLSRGRPKGTAHRRQDRGDERIPTISFDRGSATELTKQEGTQGDKREELRVLVVKDKRTKTLFSHAVVNPMVNLDDIGKTLCDLSQARIAPYKNTWKRFQNTVFWCNLKLAQQ